MFRSLTLIIAVVGAYSLLRGWSGAPTLLMRSCLAVATLVAGFVFWGVRRDDQHHRMISLRRATWIDYLSLGATIVFTEACFVVLTSTLAAPSQKWATSFHEVIMTEDLEHSENGEDVDFSGRNPGNWLFKSNLERNLPKRSNHKPGNKPEVFIQLEHADDAVALLNSRIHLRAFCFSRFDGTTWSAIPTQRNVIKAPITFPQTPKMMERGKEKSIQHRIYHGANPTGQNVFTVLSGVTHTDLSSLTQLSDDIYLLPELADHAEGYNYGASSIPIHFSDLINQTITPATSSAGSLTLPPHLSAQLNQTAEPFKLEDGLVNQLIALQHFLQDHYQYSLETKNDQNENPLKNFLYIEKRGYCEHFATAAAMLARSLKVPSRIAYGWSGGRLYKAQNMFVFRAKDAHAWTEIKLDGYGWVVFDTTPPDDDAVPESHAAPENELAPDPQNVIAEQYEQQTSDGVGDEFVGLQINPRPPLIALAVISLCAFGFLMLRVFHRPDTAPDGTPIKRPPPPYLVQFKHTCSTLGHPMPRGRTLRQQVEYLQSQDDPPSFLDELLNYHYGILFEQSIEDKTIEKQLKRAITLWKKETLGRKNTPKL